MYIKTESVPLSYPAQTIQDDQKPYFTQMSKCPFLHVASHIIQFSFIYFQAKGYTYIMYLLQYLILSDYTLQTTSATMTVREAKTRPTFGLLHAEKKREFGNNNNEQKGLYRIPRSAGRRRVLSSSEKENIMDNSQCPTDRCYCIKQDGRNNINCKYQQLSAIPSFSQTNTMFYELTFNTYNKITVIPAHAFQNLRVERIDLLTNRLSNVESGAFAGLEFYLKELFLEGNGKIPIPYEKMSNLVNLQSLHLESFTQSIIGKVNYFSYFPKLEMLLMVNIKDLSSIDSQAFVNKLGKLKHLRFKNVAFSQLPVTGLSHLRQLTALDIQDTNIKTIYDGSFRDLSNLEHLDLSYNKISMIQDDGFKDISQHLKTLVLSHNYLRQTSLTAISSKPWNNLKTMTLSYNSDLPELPQGLFKNMPQLQYLNLVGTNLKTVSAQSFFGLDDLHSLDLSWNKIERIDDFSLKHMSKLHHLKLDNQFNNGFSTPSNVHMQFSANSFRGIETTLQILELQNSPLFPEQFWYVIPTLTELKEVYASQTNVTYIPEYIFRKNIHIEILEFDKNNVTIKPSSFRGLENTLKRISLRDNGLTTISECCFHGFSALTVIDLDGNPLHCDCKLKWLNLFIEEREKLKNYFQKEYYICATPSLFSGRKFHNISVNELRCSGSVHETCNFSQQTTQFTTVTTPFASNTTVVPPVTFRFTLAGISSSSITIAWSNSGKTDITGYILQYFETSTKTTVSVPIHRHGFTYTVTNLKAATFYTICLTPEINGTQDKRQRSCQTVQTKVKVIGPDGQSGTNPDSASGSNLSSNATIGIIVASSAAFILILVGVCMVVKYKMQKLKVMQWSIGKQIAASRLQASLEDGLDGLDKVKFGSSPNEYMEIDNARLIQKFKMKNAKGKQGEFENDPTYSDRKKYASCKKVHKKRHNPYENDDDDDEIGEKDVDKDENPDKKLELELRYSAPSRLEAKELLNYNPRLSRPLPALPIPKNQSKTLDRRSNAPGKDTNKAWVFVTQASVYETNLNVDSKQGTNFSNVYHEIHSNDTAATEESKKPTV